jgi:hypothetical protein
MFFSDISHSHIPGFFLRSPSANELHLTIAKQKCEVEHYVFILATGFNRDLAQIVSSVCYSPFWIVTARRV